MSEAKLEVTRPLPVPAASPQLPLACYYQHRVPYTAGWEWRQGTIISFVAPKQAVIVPVGSGELMLIDMANVDVSGKTPEKK